MVELKLESIFENGMPQDCFVSVRLGDVQKLSRLSATELAATHVFKFPQGSDRRIGRIEVFRRIGTCSVDVDPSRDGLREVSVNCSEAGFGNLGFRVSVGTSGGATVSAKSKTEATKGGCSKKRAAKDYVARHGLEVQLSDAMQAVLRERPENPTEFLAAKLSQMSDGRGGTRLPPISCSNSAASVPMPERRLFASVPDVSGPEDMVDTGGGAKKPQRLEPLAGAIVFPATDAGAPFPPSKALLASPVVHNSRLLPLGGREGHPRFNFRRMPQCDWDRIYVNFPCFSVQAGAKPFAKMPLPSFERIYAQFPGFIAHRVHANVVPHHGRAFEVKPSVGTWCRPNFKQVIADDPKPRPTSQNSMASVLSETKPSRNAVSSSSGCWRHASSVGTWLAAPTSLRPQVHTTEAPRSHGFLPSVGTWLASVPELEPVRPRMHFMTASEMLGPMAYSVSSLTLGMRVF